MNNRLINTKVAGGGGGCTDIVDNYDPFGGNGVALYQLNGDATDVSGNYNGTASNVTYGTGVFGQAGVFNGNAYISTLGSISGSQDFTISLWVNPATNTDIQNSLFTMGTATNNGFFIYRYNQQIAIDSFGATRYTAEGFFTENSWQQVTITHSSGTNNIYKNGIFVSSFLYTWNINASSTTYIGAQIYSYTRYLTGSLDQVRIFNTALTPLEVEALYTEELCICDGTVDTLDILGDGSCIATYQLDGNANDLSGNYSGTPTNVSYGVGEFDLAGVFNGSSSYVNLPNLGILGSQARTVSLWVKLNSIPPSAVDQLYSQGTNNNKEAFNIQTTTAGKIQVSYAGKEINSSTTLSLNTWYNVIVIYKGGAVETLSNTDIYINGNQETVVDGGGATTGIANTINSDYSLGYRRNISTLFYDGSIDQVRIFNKALNQNEVDTLYAESACTYGGRQSEGTQILGDTSCIAYYKLDGTADDETGTYNGTFTTPNYGNGEFLYAGIFDGISSYVSVPNSAGNNLSTISISLWFKTSGQGGTGILINNGGADSSQQGFYLVITSSGFIRFSSSGGGDNSAGVDGTVNYADNIWHNVVLTYTAVGVGTSIYNVYVDGNNTPIISGTNGRFTGTSTQPLVIGRFARVAIEYFNGEIDQVRIFNKAVTLSEVTTLYNEGI